MAYFLLIITALLIPSAIAGLLAAPYVPTRGRDVARFLGLAKIKKGDAVYDLGCGDGKILVAAARQGAKSFGFELSFLNYLFCLFFRRGIKVRFKNFFKADFSGANLIYIFLSQAAHNKLREIFKKQLRPGSRVVTYVWPIEGWTPERVDEVSGQPNLYLYKM